MSATPVGDGPDRTIRPLSDRGVGGVAERGVKTSNAVNSILTSREIGFLRKSPFSGSGGGGEL